MHCTYLPFLNHYTISYMSLVLMLYGSYVIGMIPSQYLPQLLEQIMCLWSKLKNMHVKKISNLNMLLLCMLCDQGLWNPCITIFMLCNLILLQKMKIMYEQRVTVYPKTTQPMAIKEVIWGNKREGCDHPE